MSMEEFRSNCMVYLDLFHRCSSVKGRLQEYYQSGTVRNCSPYWNDFWFCIRLKYKSDEAATEAYEQKRTELGFTEGHINSAARQRQQHPSPLAAGIFVPR